MPKPTVTDRPLSIGIIAPPWLTVPPSAYGGTELVIDVLATGLQAAGHDVTLVTVGDSTCPVRRRHLFEHPDPDRMGATVIALRHVAAAYDRLSDPSAGIDLVHDHTLAGLFVSALYPRVQVVTTNHGPFNADLVDLYRRVADRIPVIAISDDHAGRAPADLPISAVIRHGLDLGKYPFGRGDEGYALFLGRMAPDKGVDIAIRAARAVGLHLIIAAKMVEPLEHRYFERSVQPQLGDDVEYVGEVDFEKKIELLQGAHVLINPIQWPEPFGLVMAEALACGTPVVGFANGAAPEIVDHGVTGFLSTDEAGLIADLRRWTEIDRVACRHAASARFSATRMVDEHVAVYRAAIREQRGRPMLMKSA